MTRRSMLIVAIAIVVAVAVAAALLATAPLQGNGPSEKGPAVSGGSNRHAVPPKELAELTGDLNLDDLADSAFLSILIPNEEGRPTGYMVDAAMPAAGSIIDAVRGAERLGTDDPEAVAATAPVATAFGPLPSTITFVLASRLTVTFALDLEAGLLYRDGRAFRPDGDLAALLKSAVTAGG